jgi:hypothetical protein
VDPKVQLFVDILVQPVNIGQQGVEVILKRKRREMKIVKKKKKSNFTTYAKEYNKIIISYLALSLHLHRSKVKTENTARNC